MDKFKLQWKIFAFLLGFCGLLLVILWLLQSVFLDDMYKLIRKHEMQQAIATVEKNIDSPKLQTLLDTLDAEKEIMVAPTSEFRLIEQYPPIDGGRGKPKKETLTQERTFVLADGRTLSLTFHALITPVEATVSTLQVQLSLITGIMVLLSVGLALLIARRVAKPIVDINKSAKQLAGGRYDVHFSGRGFLEICELSGTLNTAAQELSKVEMLRRELMANISHDLRTPLALIYSYAEMMHDFPGEITPEQTQTIMDETTRLSSLVNDVLDVSRLETGTMELKCMPYCVTCSIQKTVQRMAELVRNDGYTLELEVQESVMVCADEVKITQAFYNLLLNAITHGGADKSVTVRQSVADNDVTIEVTDHGEGIAAEHLPYIWDRYYKVDKKHKRSVTGTGLGLSIVKKIIDLHSGACGVNSVQGQGSTFWLSLPLAQRQTDVCTANCAREVEDNANVTQKTQ